MRITTRPDLYQAHDAARPLPDSRRGPTSTRLTTRPDLYQTHDATRPDLYQTHHDSPVKNVLRVYQRIGILYQAKGLIRIIVTIPLT